MGYEERYIYAKKLGPNTYWVSYIQETIAKGVVGRLFRGRGGNGTTYTVRIYVRTDG